MSIEASCISLVSSFRRLDNGSQLCHLLYRERVSAGCDSRMTFWPLCGTRQVIILTAEYVTSFLYTEYAPEISIADVLNCAGTYIGLLTPSNLTHEKLTSFQSGAVSDFRTATMVQARDHCDVSSWPISYWLLKPGKFQQGKVELNCQKMIIVKRFYQFIICMLSFAFSMLPIAFIKSLWSRLSFASHIGSPDPSEQQKS
jgi:hypothetical protein